MSNPEVIESPIIRLQNRGAVVFRGKVMFPSTAARINEYRPHMRRLAEAGMCLPQAARKLGFTPATVRRWAIILGISFTKQRRRMVGTSYDKTGWGDVIMAEGKAGGTMSRAAATLGVPVSNVHRWCVDNDFNWKQIKRTILDAKKQNR
jgi:hypothetical protein